MRIRGGGGSATITLNYHHLPTIVLIFLLDALIYIKDDIAAY